MHIILCKLPTETYILTVKVTAHLNQVKCLQKQAQMEEKEATPLQAQFFMHPSIEPVGLEEKMREAGVESLGDLKYLTEKCIAEICGHKAVHVRKVMEVIATVMPAATVSMPVATGVPFAAAPPLFPSSQQQ